MTRILTLKLVLFFFIAVIASGVLSAAKYSKLSASQNPPIEYPLDIKQRDYVLLGVTVNNEILLWAGLGQDNVPWIQLIEPHGGGTRRFVFEDNDLHRKVIPTAGSLNAGGRRLAILENRVPGVYDFLKARGFLIVLPSQMQGGLFSSPTWYSDSGIALFDIGNRRSIEVVDLTNRARTFSLSPPSGMFIANYDIGSNGTIVVGLGPFDESLVSLRFSPNTFGLDETRAERINLSLFEKRTKKFEPLTRGEWFDFAPKVAQRGEYVAFLRGRPNRALQKAKIENNEEYSLSNMSPALYVQELKMTASNKERQVVQNHLIKTQFDFSWKDDHTLSFRKALDKEGGSAIYLYDCRSREYIEFFRTDGLILSFVWSHDGQKLTLIERKGRDKDVLVVVH